MAKDLDQNQQTEDTQDQQPVSLRDNIRAAIDEVKEKSEREDNKLDAKSEPATEVKDTSKEDKAPDKTAERKAESKEPEQAELPLDDKKQPEKKAEEVEKKEPKAPFGTPKELRAKWSTLDQDTQGYVSKLLKENLDLNMLGIWFPFLLTCLIKTAQGSSTVAIITASAIVLPLLPILGLESENAKLLTVLAMGAGSMMISHSNDAYFWVISKFSDIDVRTMLRVHSIASVFMGSITMIVIYILSLIIL